MKIAILIEEQKMVANSTIRLTQLMCGIARYV